MCNRDRIYQTNDYLQKVIDDDFIVSAHKKNYNSLLKVNSITSLDPKVFKVTRYSNGGSSTKGGRTAATCSSYYLVDYFVNQSGCKNDRRVYVKADAFLAITGSVNGFQRLTPWVTSEVWGEIRNIWCNWKTYQTELTLYNGSFTVLSYKNTSTDPVFTTSVRVPFSFAFPSYTSDTWKITIFDGPTGTNIVGENVNPPYVFTQIHIQATSRGVGGNLAIIDCQ